MLSGAHSAVRRTSASASALLRRVEVLEKRDDRLEELAARIDGVQRDLFLAKTSVSGLGALQEVMAGERWALGSALQACLRSMLIVRLKTCPERRSARRKRSQSLLSLEHVAVCGAVDQLFAMGDVEAERVRGVAGRPAGRLVRFASCRAVLNLLACSASETAAALHKTFPRKDGTVASRLLFERHTDVVGKVWFILSRDVAEKTVEVALREPAVGSALDGGNPARLLRHTLKLEDVPGLAAVCPATLSWTPTRGYSPPLGAPEAGTPGRLTLTLPVCVVEYDGRDLQTLQ